MHQTASQTPSILFTVRLWREEVDADAWEWRGVVKHVMSGEERYFREWAALPETIKTMVLYSVEHPHE